jgi:hypothetical protein
VTGERIETALDMARLQSGGLRRRKRSAPHALVRMHRFGMKTFVYQRIGDAIFFGEYREALD